MSAQNAPQARAVRVAIDTGPLLGHRSGIGMTVACLMDALHTLDSPPDLCPYAISFRGDVPEGTSRLPIPAALAHRLWTRSSHPRLDRWLGDADVVHGTNHVVPPTRRPRVVSVYDTWFLTNPDGVHGDVRRMADVLRRSVRNGAVVHTSSHASADRLRDLLSGETANLRVEVVHLGTPPRPPATVHTSPSSRADEMTGRRFVLALGTREKRKNLPVLVHAFVRTLDSIDEADRDVRLVVAGAPGNDDPAIEAAVAGLPAEFRDQVVLLGAVSDETKEALLAGASVLAYPSLDEGFGLPLLEAMDRGVPVVASTAGSIPEVVGDAAILVRPDDVDGLASALARTLALEGADRERVATAGRARAASFTWADTARRMVDLYSALAMENRPS